jgi:hypothetical protein
MRRGADEQTINADADTSLMMLGQLQNSVSPNKWPMFIAQEVEMSECTSKPHVVIAGLCGGDVMCLL